MSNLTTDQMAEIIIRSTRETAKEFARKRQKIHGNGKKTATPPHKVSPAPAKSRKFERNA